MAACCESCGMAHAPDDLAACIEGHGDDPPGWDTGLDAAEAQQRIAGLQAEVDELRHQLGLPLRYGGEIG